MGELRLPQKNKQVDDSSLMRPARIFFAGFFGFLILYLSISSIALAGAAALGPLAQASDASVQQKELEKQRLELQKERAALGRQKKSITAEISGLDRKGSVLRRELANDRRELGSLNRREKKSLRESGVLGKKLGDLRGHLAKRMRSIYKVGLLQPLLFLLESRSPADLYERYKRLHHMAEAEQMMIRNVRGTLADQRIVLTRIAREGREIETLIGKVKKKQGEITRLRRKKEKRVSGIIKDDRELVRLIDEVVEQEKGLKKLVEISNRSKVLASQSREVSPVARRKGVLPWPVKGKIIHGFGSHRHPVFNAVVKSSGLEIQAPRGTPVLAIAEGEVVYADWWQGSGNLVILDHGGEYKTLYLHLDTLSVRNGNKVLESQVLGTVGDSDSMIGTSLGLQIRNRGVPLDPLLYLRPR